MYYKTTVEGEDQVCDIVQAYAAKSYNKGRSEAISITVQVLLDFVSSGNISLDDAIKKSKLSRKEFLDIAAQLGFNN